MMYCALGRFDLRVKNVKTRLIPVATGNRTQAAAERTPASLMVSSTKQFVNRMSSEEPAALG
jgi:hypothetical protein